MKYNCIFKKIFAFLLTFIIIILSINPISALAQDYNSDATTYSIDETIYAGAYMLINLDDESYPVVAQFNQDIKKYPASLTKIVTTMVVLNNVSDLSETVVASADALAELTGSGAQVAGISANEEISVETLLYLTMVYSACDACRVLAYHVAGSTEAFVEMMNEWVKSLGFSDTNFFNPDGLHDSNHYTTASDLAKITLEALKSDTFNKISKTTSYEYKGSTFIHTNYMLDKYHVTYYYEYAEGIKTGSTSEANYCVITTASKDGYNYLAVVLDSPIEHLNGYDTKCSFIDAKTLFEWAFNSLKYATIFKTSDVLSEIGVVNGKDADTVQLVAEEDVLAIVPSALDSSQVIIEPIDAPEEIEAPITKGDYVCQANLIYNNQVIATINLVAASTIELSTILKIINAVKDFLSNPVVLIILVVIIVLVLLYLIWFVKRINTSNKKAKARKQRQQERYSERNNSDYLPPPRR